VARHPSIKLFAGLFTVSLLLSCGLAYQITSQMTFAFPITPEAAATLTARVQAVRAISLTFALLLMLLVIFAASRASRGALALRWVVGVVTSIAFLRGAGLVDQLSQFDAPIIATSAFQLGAEALAVLLLYGEDANEWFDLRR
jgi:hypothetical protein